MVEEDIGKQYLNENFNISKLYLFVFVEDHLV